MFFARFKERMKLNKLLIIGFSSILLTGVVSAKEKAPKAPKAPKRSFEVIDSNKDGKISEAEFTAGAKNVEKATKRFKKKDKDADGFLSMEEFAKKAKKEPKQPIEPKEQEKAE